MSRDVAPVIAAQALLRHGMQDDEVIAYISRAWALDEIDCGAAVRAAHVLLRRESPTADPAVIRVRPV